MRFHHVQNSGMRRPRRGAFARRQRRRCHGTTSGCASCNKLHARERLLLVFQLASTSLLPSKVPVNFWRGISIFARSRNADGAQKGPAWQIAAFERRAEPGVALRGGRQPAAVLPVRRCRGAPAPPPPPRPRVSSLPSQLPATHCQFAGRSMRHVKRQQGCVAGYQAEREAVGVG